jgi:chromosome segregation ATPase
MSFALRKLVGFLLVLTAVFGLIVNGYGLVTVWQWKMPITESIQGNIVLLSEMVSTSSEMLVLVEDTLGTAATELLYLEESLLTMAKFIQNADPLLVSLQGLTGENLPSTLRATQDSLKTAQQSSDIIETVLRAISSIPFFPGEPYNPQVPLSESLKRIENNLSSIQPSLLTIQDNLESTRANLEEMDSNISQIVAATDQVQLNLKDAQTIIERYQGQVETTQEKLASYQSNIEYLVTRILTFAIVWLSLAQIGLLLQGFSLLLGDPK